jgi:hypothetical protein
MTEQIAFVSFGYRCSSAGILKRLGRKHESYPFDWIISRLPVIQHCIDTGFTQYLNVQNYKDAHTITQHYDDRFPCFICEEDVQYNTYYVDLSMSSYHTSTTLTKFQDTYAYPMAMNHHTIQKDYDYFGRCVGRLHTFLENPAPNKMFLYIHPALYQHEYTEELIEEIKAFQIWLRNKIGWDLGGLVFLPIKTNVPYPITDVYQDVLEPVYTPLISNDATCFIYKVYMNRDFVDAGEIFYRNAYIETDKMVDFIRDFNIHLPGVKRQVNL